MQGNFLEGLEVGPRQKFGMGGDQGGGGHESIYNLTLLGVLGSGGGKENNQFKGGANGRDGEA